MLFGILLNSKLYKFIYFIEKFITICFTFLFHFQTLCIYMMYDCVACVYSKLFFINYYSLYLYLHSNF